jgi:hypothetical protein
LEVLSRWQTLVGALLGFGGVILTLLVNAALARRTERLTREREMKALCVALQQELLEYRKALGEQTRALHDMGFPGPQSNKHIELYPLIFRQVFDANIERLGLLRPEQVSATLQAYNRQQSLVRVLRAYSQSYREDGAINIKADRAHVVSGWYDIAEGYMTTAIRSLGGPDWKEPHPVEEEGDDMTVAPLPRLVLSGMGFPVT